MELTKKHIVRLYKIIYLLLIVILVLIKPYNTVTASSHYSNKFNIDLSKNDHHLNNIRFFLNNNNNDNNTIITKQPTTTVSSLSLITEPNSQISNSTLSSLSTIKDLKNKSLFIEYTTHFIYPPFGFGKLINPMDQKSNENFPSNNTTQLPPLMNKNRDFIKLSNKLSDHHNSFYFTTSSSSSSLLPKNYYYNQNHSGYHQYYNTTYNTKRNNKNRTIEEQNSNTIRNNNNEENFKRISRNNMEQSIDEISIEKLPQSTFNRQHQHQQQQQHIPRKEQNQLLNSENAINLHQSKKSNKLQISDNIDNYIDVNIYGIEFKRNSIDENSISPSLSSNTKNNKDKSNSLEFQSSANNKHNNKHNNNNHNKHNNNNNHHQYFNQTFNSNNSINQSTLSSGKNVLRIKKRSINEDNNSESSITNTNNNNENDNNYNPIINDYMDVDENDIDDEKQEQIDDINRISDIKSTILTNTINFKSKNNCNNTNNILNNNNNNSSMLLIDDCINNNNTTNLTVSNNFNKNTIHNNKNNNNNNDIHNNNNNKINTTLILNNKLQLLNNNSDYLININNNNTFNINNNNNIINKNITILYDENINNNLSINSNSSEEEECSLECDDCIPCNATYEEYMQYLYDYIYPSRSEWILIATHCVVFITGLVGNALVCVAVYTNYSMRTVTNVYIVNLAIADFFVILICLPPSVVWDVTETWFLGESMCKIVLYFQSISVTVSVLTLTFISVDRWYAICFPLRYRTKITRAVASVAFIWIVALVSDVPEFLALHLKPMNSKLRYETILFTQCQTTWDIETEKNFYIVRLVTLYLLPLLLMTIAYFKIVRVLWKSETIPGHRESRNQHQYSTCGYSRGSQMPASNTSTMGQLRARRKAAKMLVAVVIMFAVCYAPVHTFNLMRYTDTLPHNELTSIFSLLSHWLCYANSAINPIIYNFMSGKFRREFRNALEKCRCARVRVEDRSLNHSTPASRLNNVSPGSRSNYQLTSVRDITRDISRQTMQTTFVENYGNGHSAAIPMLNNEKKDQIT